MNQKTSRIIAIVASCALLAFVTAAGPSNPVDRIQRGGGRVVVGPTGNITSTVNSASGSIFLDSKGGATSFGDVNSIGQATNVSLSDASNSFLFSTRNTNANTSFDGFTATNTASASAGSQIFSPRTVLSGNGWKTSSGGASQAVAWGIDVRPVQGVGAPTSKIVFAQSINGGAYADVSAFTSAGFFGVGTISPTAMFSVGASSQFQVNTLGDAFGRSFTFSTTQSGSSPALTVGSGTGITVNAGGEVRETIYKVTISSTAFICAATTCDVTVATLPAKTLITGVVADLTTTFACASTCTTSTLSFVFGRGAGGAQWLASFDADAATAQFGDADAELGTTMARAAAVQAGSFENWAGTQAAVLRLTSGTGNIGNGAATNLSQGSVTIYLQTTVMP